MNRPSFSKVHHIALKVRDLNISEKFYHEILGLSVVARHQDDHGLPRSVWLQMGEVILMLEIIPHAEAGIKKIEEGWHLVALQIDESDRQKWKDYLKEEGIAVEQESLHTIYFHDPFGNRVALTHYPEKKRF